MTHTYLIQNIRCGGCASTITKKLQQAGFVVLEVSPEREAVVIDATDPLRVAQGEAILKGLGYPLQGASSGMVDSARSFVSCAVGKFGT